MKFSPIIHICKKCGKVDIDTDTHGKTDDDFCDPEYEQTRQLNQDYYD